jgi:hypothetical protein
MENYFGKFVRIIHLIMVGERELSVLGHSNQIPRLRRRSFLVSCISDFTPKNYEKVVIGVPL